MDGKPAFRGKRIEDSLFQALRPETKSVRAEVPPCPFGCWPKRRILQGAEQSSFKRINGAETSLAYCCTARRSLRGSRWLVAHRSLCNKRSIQALPGGCPRAPQQTKGIT